MRLPEEDIFSFRFLKKNRELKVLMVIIREREYPEREFLKTIGEPDFPDWEDPESFEDDEDEERA